MSQPTEITALREELDATEREARVLVAGLPGELGTWRPSPTSWSIAECLDHLARANAMYVHAMNEPARRARSEGRRRRRPATPGLIGRWFIRSLEPPTRATFKVKAPASIRPRTGVTIGEAFDAFDVSHQSVLAFVDEYWDLDLAGVRFVNPFFRYVRFSLATGLHVISAHERRHLWQARRVRQAAEDR